MSEWLLPQLSRAIVSFVFAFGGGSLFAASLPVEAVWPDVESEIPLTNPARMARAPYSGPVFETRSFGGSAEPITVGAGERCVFRFDFGGTMPTEEFDFEVRFCEGDDLGWRESLRATKGMLKELSERRWRLQFEVSMPAYFDTRSMQAHLASPALRLKDGSRPVASFRIVRSPCAPGCGRPIRSSVEKVAGIPQFHLNGRPFVPLWSVGIGNGSLDERNPLGRPHHSNAPFDLTTVWPAPRAIWPRLGEFKSVVYDRFVEELTRQFGTNCLFMVEIPLNPPPDWRAANPDDMCRQEDGTVNAEGSENFINYSFASGKARALMLETLEKAIAYLENSPYANRIYGYRIGSGHTYEWLGWSGRPRTAVLDFSPAARRGFEAYLARRHPEVADRSIPGGKERFRRDAGELFADLKANPRCKAFYDYYCDEIADTMMTMCRRAKELLGGRKVVGTYYGYSMTLFECGEQMRGHYSLARVLDSGAIDFLMSPPPYGVRRLGDICGEMKPFATMQARGILPVLEDDSRTHMHPAQRVEQTPNDELSTFALRRNMGTALCRGEPFYALAINDGLNFDFPQFGYDAAAIRAAGAFALKTGVARNAEIAVVVSEESIKALPRYEGPRDAYRELVQTYPPEDRGKARRKEGSSGIPLVTESYNRILKRISRLGAPVDYLLAEDLAHARDYRLYVFVNCSCASDAFVRSVRALRDRPCALLWIHAPGYAGESGRGVSGMRDLTGVAFENLGAFDPETELGDGTRVGGTGNRGLGPFFAMVEPDETLGRYVANGKPAVTVKRTGPSLTLHCGSYRAELPVLEEAVRRAGVWRYTDSDDPVEANGAFVLLHARRPGRKVVRLPRQADVVDVFARRIVARGVREYAYESALHETHLLYYGPNADDFLRCLQK